MQRIECRMLGDYEEWEEYESEYEFPRDAKAIAEDIADKHGEILTEGIGAIDVELRADADSPVVALEVTWYWDLRFATRIKENNP